MSKLEFVDIRVFGISKWEGNVKKNFFPFCDHNNFSKRYKMSSKLAKLDRRRIVNLIAWTTFKWTAITNAGHLSTLATVRFAISSDRNFRSTFASYVGNKGGEIWEGCYTQTYENIKSLFVPEENATIPSFRFLFSVSATSIVEGIRFVFDGTLLMIHLPSTWVDLCLIRTWALQAISFSSESRILEIIFSNLEK